MVATARRVGAPESTVFHCFSGGEELARLAADAGWYLSFAGNITFKNAENLREALRVLPRERILVETDAPYLTPVPLRGRPNAPYLVPHTMRFMAAGARGRPRRVCALVAANTVARTGRGATGRDIRESSSVRRAATRDVDLSHHRDRAGEAGRERASA